MYDFPKDWDTAEVVGQFEDIGVPKVIWETETSAVVQFEEEVSDKVLSIVSDKFSIKALSLYLEESRKRPREE
jgi:hypothetical protein